jgi:hypothetical protein
MQVLRHSDAIGTSDVSIDLANINWIFKVAVRVRIKTLHFNPLKLNGNYMYRLL